MSTSVPGKMNAKEAEYHQSCREQFLMETEDQDRSTEGSSSQYYLKSTFTSLLSFIKDMVVEEQCSD